MNHLQRYNQRMIRRAVGQRNLLIASVQVSKGNVVEVESLVWEEYWRDSDALAGNCCTYELLGRSSLDAAVCSITRPVRSGVFCVVSSVRGPFLPGHRGSSIAPRVVGFETFRISGEQAVISREYST